MVIMRPLPVAAYAGSFNGVGNLLTPDPKEVAVMAAGTSYYIDIDLGADQLVDTFFLGFITAAPTTTWALQVKDSMGGATTAVLVNNPLVRALGGTGPRYHVLHKAAAPITGRYFRFWLGQPAGSVAPFPQAGIVALGLAFQPAYNREWGPGRQIVDTGARESLLGGGFGIGEGARKAAYRWTFGDLSDAEIATLYDLALDRGETQPVLVVEDPDQTVGLSSRIHYGLFNRFEAYERTSPGNTRWSLSMEEWV